MIKNLAHFLKWAEKLFIANKLYFGHGTANAWDEAVFIASHVLKINLYIESLTNRLLTQSEIKKLKKIAFLRAKTKKPLAYIIKTAWFAGRSYYVNSNVIIPRSPIAELINNRFRPWLKKKPHKILDLCTGSGCIAIACFHEFIKDNYKIKIDASDICSKALTIAAKNLKLHNIDHNAINLIKSDLFNNINNKYNLIISNPPYVDQKDFNKLPQEFYFEPKKALVAGMNGFELVSKILYQAKNFLLPNGVLIVEVGVNWRKLVKLYPKVKFTWLKFKNGGEGIFLLTKQQLDLLT